MICRSLSHTFHSTHYITKKYPKGILKVSTFGIDKNLLPSFPYTRQSPHDTEFTQKEMKPQPFVPGIFPSFIIFIIFQTGFQINFFIFTRGSGRGFRGGGRRWRLPLTSSMFEKSGKVPRGTFCGAFREKMRCLLVQNHGS